MVMICIVLYAALLKWGDPEVMARLNAAPSDFLLLGILIAVTQVRTDTDRVETFARMAWTDASKVLNKIERRLP